MGKKIVLYLQLLLAVPFLAMRVLTSVVYVLTIGIAAFAYHSIKNSPKRGLSEVFHAVAELNKLTY